MPISFYINRETGEPHILDHEVRQDEAAEVLQTAIDDTASRGGSRVATGPTSDGRVLRVVYVGIPASDDAFVITAFELRGKPLAADRRRMRRRNR